MAGAGLTDILTAVQNAVTAANNLTQLLSQATVNSSSLRVQIAGVSTTTGTVTQVNGGYGLVGGPITASGSLAVSLTNLSNSLSSDRVLNNVTTYFDGPSVAQGTSGVWLACGTVTVADSAGVASMVARLSDGTTVVAAAESQTPGAGALLSMPLSGIFTSPSSNIRIQVLDRTNTTGKIVATNNSTGALESTISVVRIG